jgi:hypothetical protein
MYKQAHVHSCPFVQGGLAPGPLWYQTLRTIKWNLLRKMVWHCSYNKHSPPAHFKSPLDDSLRPLQCKRRGNRCYIGNDNVKGVCEFSVQIHLLLYIWKHVFFFLVVSGFELRASGLLGKGFTPPAFFALVIFEIEPCFLPRPDHNPSIRFPAVAGIRYLLLHPAIGWDGVSWTFCLGWLLTTIFLISASRVARIIGLIPDYSQIFLNGCRLIPQM